MNIVNILSWKCGIKEDFLCTNTKKKVGKLWRLLGFGFFRILFKWRKNLWNHLTFSKFSVYLTSPVTWLFEAFLYILKIRRTWLLKEILIGNSNMSKFCCHYFWIFFFFLTPESVPCVLKCSHFSFSVFPVSSFLDQYYIVNITHPVYKWFY